MSGIKGRALKGKVAHNLSPPHFPTRTHTDLHRLSACQRHSKESFSVVSFLLELSISRQNCSWIKRQVTLIQDTIGASSSSTSRGIFSPRVIISSKTQEIQDKRTVDSLSKRSQESQI